VVAFISGLDRVIDPWRELHSSAKNMRYRAQQPLACACFGGRGERNRVKQPLWVLQRLDTELGTESARSGPTYR
jgi:hypothetical protein